MPFNENGQFIRVHNWTEDKSNNIPITASRMDAEDDGFADGLSQTFLRDGSIALTGDLKAGNNKLTGLKNGTESTDAATIGQLNTVQGNAVLLTGDQTVAGVKTFTSSPIAPTVSADDNSTKIATTAWVNTTGNNVVHLTDDETITGAKTFTQNIVKSSDSGYSGYYVQSTTLTKGKLPSSNIGAEFAFQDKNGLSSTNRIGDLKTSISSINGNVFTSISAYQNGSSTYPATLGVYYPSTGNPYATCPTPDDTTSTSSIHIPTVGWVNTTGNNVVHIADTETITGAKTFEVKGASTDAFFIKNKAIELGTIPSINIHTRIYFKDKNSNNIACLYNNVANSGDNSLILQITKNDGNNNLRTNMGLTYPANGNPYAWCPTPNDTTADTTSNQVVTVGWGSTHFVTLDTTQTISGSKTFTSKLNTAPIELYPSGNSATPYIDFHYNGSSSDYTSRIIESASGELSIECDNVVVENYLTKINNDITAGTAPTSNKHNSIIFVDKNQRPLGWVYSTYSSSKESVMRLQVRKTNTSTDDGTATIGIWYPASGDPYAKAPASDVNGSIVTTVNCRKGTSSSDNGVGYVKFGNGLIVQWGRVTGITTNKESTVTFPTSFTSATSYTIVKNYQSNSGSEAGDREVCFYDMTTTTAKTWSASTDTNTFSWIAIGY